MKLVVGDLDYRVAEALRSHSNQLLENAAEMSGDKQTAAFPCGEKIIAVKNKMDDGLPDSDKVDIIHNCVLRVLPEDFAKIRLVVAQCLRKMIQGEIFCKMMFYIMQDLAGCGRKAGGFDKVRCDVGIMQILDEKAEKQIIQKVVDVANILRICRKPVFINIIEHGLKVTVILHGA